MSAPEIVHCTYRVKPEAEETFLALLRRHWPVLREQGLTTDSPAVAWRGEEDGRWTWWHPNGERMAEGEFDRGQRIGEWTFWYEDGGLQMEGVYVQGVGHGQWTHWHPTGFVRSRGRMKDGELSGRWQVWEPDGTLDEEASGVYREGDRVED